MRWLAGVDLVDRVIVSIVLIELRWLWLCVARWWTMAPPDDAADKPDGETTPTDGRADDLRPAQHNQNCACCPQPPSNPISLHGVRSDVTGVGPRLARGKSVNWGLERFIVANNGTYLLSAQHKFDH